jgi:hypothetical protein
MKTPCYICVRILLYMCPHATKKLCAAKLNRIHLLLYASSHSYTCVFILLYMCPHTAIYVSSYCYIPPCICVLTLLHMCLHTTVHVSSYCYICVLILLYMCPHNVICVLTLLHRCLHTTICVLIPPRKRVLRNRTNTPTICIQNGMLPLRGSLYFI